MKSFKIFTGCSYDKELIPRIYKKMQKLSTPPKNKAIHKQMVWWNEHSFQNIPGQLLFLKGLTPLVIRKMQTKGTLRYYFSPIRMTIVNKPDKKCWRRKKHPYTLLVGAQIIIAYMEINLEVPQNFNNRTSMWLSYFFPAHIPKELHTIQ